MLTLLETGCNQSTTTVAVEPPKDQAPVMPTADAQQFQDFLNYFEDQPLPTEVFHNSFLNPKPIPKELCMKYLGFQGASAVQAFGKIPLSPNFHVLVTANRPFDKVIYFQLYVFDKEGKRISSLEIAGLDETWLGNCVFEDNGLIRLEARTPDMDVDESEPLSLKRYRTNEKGEVIEMN